MKTLRTQEDIAAQREAIRKDFIAGAQDSGFTAPQAEFMFKYLWVLCVSYWQ